MRNFLFMWRTFVQVRLTLFVFVGMSLILGFLFFQAGYDQKGSHYRASLLYFSLIVTNLMVIRTSSPLSLFFNLDFEMKITSITQTIYNSHYGHDNFPACSLLSGKSSTSLSILHLFIRSATCQSALPANLHHIIRVSNLPSSIVSRDST